MEIIVLKTVRYKESDGIIEAINENEKVSLLVRGLYSSKSKNAFLNNSLTIADVELNEGKYKYPVVKSSLSIASPLNLHNQLSHMAVIMGITEATLNLLSDEEKPLIYTFLKETIASINKQINPYTVLIRYLAKTLKLSGYDFNVNSCVKCGNKKSIVAFSFNEGGFICSNCDNIDIDKSFNKNQMLAIREAFNDETLTPFDIEISDDELVYIIHKFYEFIYDSYGYKMKSKDLL